MSKQHATNIANGKARLDITHDPKEEKRNKNRKKYTDEQILEMAEIFKTNKRAAVLWGMEFGMSEKYAIDLLYGRARPELIPPWQPKEETEEQEPQEPQETQELQEPSDQQNQPNLALDIIN